ncbi:MAG: zinc-ribbon domain-containing protein, partial [Candidatus Helarchaeota archaeon]|nr:zinc-ribbon domain-containing protein [Candidatus Helarchaeota archaeon]
GNYTFTFKAWGNDIKNINFVIENSSNDLPEDTIPPTIMPESMTNLTGLEILAGMPVTIKVNVSYAGGISEVWLNYTVDGIPQIPILMTLVDFGNGTIFSRFSGTIPGQPAGSVVNFSITVVDKYGHSYTSNSFSYGVVIEIDSFNFIPMTLIIFTVFGIVVTSLIIYNKLHLQRPRRASLRDIPYHVPSRMMQQHAVNIPSSSLLPNSIFCSYCGFQNDPTKPFCQKCGTEIGPLTSRYISLDNDEYQTIDDGRLEPSDSMTPDYDDYQTIDYNPIDPSDSSLSPSYQNHAGQVEGFTFLHLYGVFTAILKAFPSVAQMFPREERLNYVMELKNLPIEEQYALFNAMIARNSAHEMRNQLNYLMREFKTGETEENWVPALQKLEKFIAVALADGDRELIAELMQLSILIKYSL